MTTWEVWERARTFASLMHRDQKDKAGDPYVGHLRRVAGRCPSYLEGAVAWLHDVVEDTPCTLEDLRGLGFRDEIVEAVGILTRSDDESYMEYIRRVRSSGNVTAVRVKIADLDDHLFSIENIPESLVVRYRKAYNLMKL